MSTPCAFCTVAENKDREILRTDLVWAFPTNAPIVEGHVLVCPIRCVATIAELSREERDAIFTVAEHIKHALRTGMGAVGFNHAWNEHVVGGQSVPHFHLHIIPRTEKDEVRYGYEPRQFLYRPSSERPIVSQEDLLVVSRRIAQHLS